MSSIRDDKYLRGELSHVLLCPTCQTPLRFDSNNFRACCVGAGPSRFLDGIVCYQPISDTKSEMAIRDQQAPEYLRHSKFPTQIARINRFVGRLRSRSRDLPILDLGCGPGPTTSILLTARFSVVAIDLSLASLKINYQRCFGLGPVLYVHADLTNLRFAKNSVSGLMMSDFLQHLETHDVRRQLLHEAFAALSPGGWFFLSFLNVNLKNRLKSDIEGSFDNDGIHYRRLTAEEVMRMLPNNVRINDVVPMNVFDRALPDRLVTRVPFARHFARWMLLSGFKESE
jgi:SAM-dependent methyltransferase